MNAPGRLIAFAAVIVASFGGALALGAAVGPIDVSGSNHSVHLPTPSSGTTVSTEHQAGH